MTQSFSEDELDHLMKIISSKLRDIFHEQNLSSVEIITIRVVSIQVISKVGSSLWNDLLWNRSFIISGIS